MVAAVTEALTKVLQWMGTVISAIIKDTGALNALLPLFAIGIGISVVFLGIKIVRKICWGA